MKRIFIFYVLIAAGLLALPSCQKSWTCTCTKGAPPSYLTDDTQNQADRVCAEYQNSVQVKYPTAQCRI